jgi:hypothetical protein
MRALKLSIICTLLLLVAFFSGALAKTDPLSKANRLPPSLENKVQAFKQALEAEGYEVARGYWDLYTVKDCSYPVRSLGYCYGNNPTAPYVLAFVPAWKDEFVDQSLHHALTQARKGMHPNYRLGEREALVVLAELPPPARYLGYLTYVFTREAELNPDDLVYERLSLEPELLDLRQIVFGASPNPERMMMVASMGDTINNVVIDEDSSNHKTWGEQRFFVTTPDADMADAMIEALKEVGVKENDVFTEKVSPDLVNLGYGPEADDFFTLIRYAMPDDPTLGEQWRKQLPLTVLRVRDKEGGPAKDPFEIPEYEEKKANFDENSLQGDLDILVQAVKDDWEQKNASILSTLSFRSLTLWVDLVGQHCLGYDGPPPTDCIGPPIPYPDKCIELPRGPMDCLGDNQDDEPQISAGTYHLDDGQVIAVVGTLGTETGNATYTSLSVNWFPELVGVLNLTDEDLKGSAIDFTSDDRFYVYYFARDCSGLPEKYCQEVSRQVVPKGDTIKIAQRNYVNPDTRRAPDPWQILNPVAIEFEREAK